MKLNASLASLLLLLPTTALGAVSAPDDGGYRAMDSLVPAPALPDSMLTLMTGSSSSGSYSELEDDESYSLSFGTSSQVYGYADSSWTVHTNGFITSSGTSDYFINNRFPDSNFGSRQVLAPYWDDLVPVDGLSTLTWEEESGSHVIVQWTDFALYSDPTARLTFRVTIGLNDGWVLFQYIKLEGADGGGATIGIQDRYQYAWNNYSHNTPAALVTGTAPAGTALHAILFDLDSDNDSLLAYLEVQLGGSDSSVDSDGGGVTDAAEFAGGTLIDDASDDDGTDTDSDGLSDIDEAFYGSDSSLPDTDADTLGDYDEVFTYGTNPSVADTDGDTFDDAAEVLAGTDPNNAGDFPITSVAVSGDSKHKIRAEVCDDGNVHVVAINDSSDEGLFYYQLAPDGTVRIAETELLTGEEDVKYAGLACFGGTVYVTYELLTPISTGDDDDDNGGGVERADQAQLGIIAIDPSLDDQSGDAADATVITTGSVLLDIAGNPRHHHVVAASNGLHFVYDIHEDAYPDGNGDEEQVGYARADFDLVKQAELVLAEFPRKKGDGDEVFGTHKNHTPRVAVDAAGVAHVVFSAQSAPYYQSNDATAFPSGVWYAAIADTTVQGPHYLSHGRIERLDVAMEGDLLFLSLAAGYDTDNDFYKSQGVRYGVLNTQAYTVIPRTGSAYDFDTTAIPEGAMVVPIAPVFTNNESMQGARITLLADGVSIHSYTKDWDDDMCMIAVGADGTVLGDEVCFFDGEASHYTRHRGVVTFDDGIGVAFNDWDSDMFYARIQFEALYDPSNVPSFPARNAPEFTSTPTTYGVVGETYMYSPVAVDADDDIESYSLVSGPATLSFDGTTMSWTPTAAEVGDTEISIEVADTFGLTDTQSWTVAVFDPNAAAGDDDDAAGDDDDAAGDDDDDDDTGAGCDCNSSIGGSQVSSAWALLLLLGAVARRRRE